MWVLLYNVDSKWVDCIRVLWCIGCYDLVLVISPCSGSMCPLAHVRGAYSPVLRNIVYCILETHDCLILKLSNLPYWSTVVS